MFKMAGEPMEGTVLGLQCARRCMVEDEAGEEGTVVRIWRGLTKRFDVVLKATGTVKEFQHRKQCDEVFVQKADQDSGVKDLLK